MKSQKKSNVKKRKDSSKQKRASSASISSNVPKKKLQEKAKDNEGNLECDICGKILSRKDVMQRHKIVVHKTGGELFCNICAKLFSTREELDEHKTKCVRKPKKSDIPAKFECDICGTILKNRSIIRNHMRLKHTPSAKKFKCTLCELSFVNQWLRDIHHNRTHLDIKEYMCSTCGRSFKTKNQLKSHTNSHTGERPFKCTFDGCNKSFKSRSNRDTHMRSHTGEKRIKCTVQGCGQQFAYNKDLRRHKFRLHGIFVREYPCSLCSEVFPEKWFLVKHMVKHNIQY